MIGVINKFSSFTSLQLFRSRLNHKNIMTRSDLVLPTAYYQYFSSVNILDNIVNNIKFNLIVSANIS